MTSSYSPKNYSDFNVCFLPVFLCLKQQFNFSTSSPQLNSIKFLVMLCFVPYVSTFSYSSLQSKIFLLKQFSLLVISAMSTTAAIISPGCQNSSLLVAPGTLVSNCLYHEVKPHFCHRNGLPLKKIKKKIFSTIQLLC